jgi:hypothetical protein
VRKLVSTLLMNLDKISSFVATTLGRYDRTEWRFRHGPGAISERIGPTNKYCWSNWSNRLEVEYPIADCGFHNYCSWAGSSRLEDIGSLEPASRLLAVPKTFTGPRLIAAEPSEHMWCQQNLWHYMASRVQDSWISDFVRFRDQSRNQHLCRRGSEDGSLATVDLSAASDRVTCHFVGQYFRSNPGLILALRSTRTRYLRQEINPRVESLVELRKFSTMGSACTFPIQSLAFLGICLAAVATKRGLKVSPRSIRALCGEVAVFGDDLIIPEDSRELLFQALEVLHFKVNVNKSFWTGRFRESCGVDAFMGESVTPAYWRNLCSSKPESIASTIEVRNNFYSKFLLRTSARIASTIPVTSVPSVAMNSGVCGLTSFTSRWLKRDKRWNPQLQRIECKVRAFTARNPRTPITDDSALFQYFTESPSPHEKWVGGVAQRPELKHRLRWVALDDMVP